MKRLVAIPLLACFLLVAAHGQTPGKTEFEVASIKASAPQSGFHFAADSAFGGPGTADPGMFRCSKCSLANLIIKAFNLQPYQFPGRTSLPDGTYEVTARVPADASEEEFGAMLQSLLKTRFGLVGHFQEKKMKGYHLVVDKSGAKLKESADGSPSPAADQHRSGQGESHNHTGVVAFGSSANYRAAKQTTAGLTRVLSEQLDLPIDDQTGLTSMYDIALRWSGNTATHPGNHAGGGGYTGHDGAGGVAPGPAADDSGPTLFDALQQQLGLRLIPAEQALARMFVVDQVSQKPTEN